MVVLPSEDRVNERGILPGRGLSVVMTTKAQTRKARSGWRTDYFAVCEFHQFWGWCIILLIALAASLFLPFLAKMKGATINEVVVYTSQDQVYAEPILKKFERQAGIRVRAVYDSEAIKTVGLVNRLLA